jgi:hypothetical protein
VKVVDKRQKNYEMLKGNRVVATYYTLDCLLLQMQILLLKVA